MSPNPTVRTYLRSMAERLQWTSPAQSFPFVTISRQPGAGGRALAEAILLETQRRKDDPLFEGWRMFDEVELQKVAAETRLNHARALRDSLAGDIPVEPSLLKLFFALRAAACVGKAVILGRGGACLTGDLPLGVHVRLVASEASRARAIAGHLGLSFKEGQKRLKILGDCRTAFVRDHFARRVEDPMLYDAMFNTDAVRPELIARFLCDQVVASNRSRAEAPEPPLV